MEATKPLVNLTGEVQAGERKELSREEARWMVRKQELEQKRKALDPKVAMVNYGEETEAVTDIEKRLAEVAKVDNEIKEAEAKLKEIRGKLSVSQG